MQIKVEGKLFIIARMGHVTAYKLVLKFCRLQPYWPFYCALESEIMSIRHHLDDFHADR